METSPPARRLAFSLVLIGLVLLPFILILGPQYLAAREQGLGRAAAEAGDFPAAARHLAAAAALLPAEPELWETAGFYAWQAREASLAIGYLERALERGQLSQETLIILGDAYESEADYENAVRAWRAAAQTTGPSIEVLERLAAVHRRTGDTRGLEEDLAALFRLRPEGAIFFELGLLLAVSDPDRALEYLNQAGAADPDLAEVAAELDRTIRRARLIDDDPAYTLTAVGRTLAARGEWAYAREAFINAVAHNPGYADAWAFLAEARQQTGGDGLPDLQTAYTLDPASLVVNTFYALYAQRQGQYAEALGYLEAALGADPNNPTLLAEMAGTMSALGDIQTAINLFLEAISADPKNPVFWRLLAVFSIENVVQVADLGLPAAREALLLDPDNPAAHDLVGEAYLALENPLLAERFFLEALSRDPEYAPAYLHLGLLKLTAGDTAGARRDLEKVLALAPDTPTGDMAQNILDRFIP